MRASVEERVRQALTRAEALELELESTRQHHHCELQVSVWVAYRLQHYFCMLSTNDVSVGGISLYTWLAKGWLCKPCS